MKHIKKYAVGATMGAGLLLWAGNAAISETDASSVAMECESPAAVPGLILTQAAVSSCVNVEQISEDIPIEYNSLAVDVGIGVLGAGIGVAVAKQYVQFRSEWDACFKVKA